VNAARRHAWQAAAAGMAPSRHRDDGQTLERVTCGDLRRGCESHGLIARPDALAARPGHQLTYQAVTGSR
jgi:hypothetical protein